MQIWEYNNISVKKKQKQDSIKIVLLNQRTRKDKASIFPFICCSTVLEFWQKKKKETQNKTLVWWIFTLGLYKVYL